VKHRILPFILLATLGGSVPAAAQPAAVEPPAQITRPEYVARRDSLAAHLSNGLVLGFGGVTPVTDFGPFYQLPAFRYLTGYLDADAALAMVVTNGRPSRSATRKLTLCAGR
jgi:hypothetical protein